MSVSNSRTLLTVIGICAFALQATGAGAASRPGMGGLVPHVGKSDMVQALEVAPTGDGASEQECKRYEVAINSWREEVLDRVLEGDNTGAGKAERNQKALQDEATDAGCFIIY